MMRYLFQLLFCFISISISQTNSVLYENTKLIKIHSINSELADSLLRFNIKPISCRTAIAHSDLIVNDRTIDWLKDNNIPFSLLSNDVKQMIDLQMEKIQIKKNNRSSNWFSTYRELDEIENKIENIVETSQIVSKELIGQSYEGRDIAAIKISVDNGIANKPSIVINGCQHAREWITPMVTTYLIEKLAQDYISVNEITTFLDNVDIHIIPVVNPDGYVYTWEQDRWWRKNRQINNGSDCVGTDLNRNWDFDWNGNESTSEDPCSYIYVGSGPFSSPETYCVSQYISSIPNLVSHIDVHSYSALIVGPWSSSDELTEDNDEIFCLGTHMQKAVSNTDNYPYIFGTGTVNNLLYLISGGMVDWVYGDLSALSFLYEMRPANLYYFDTDFNGLSAFDNEEEEILPTCEEFYQGVLEMIKWAYFGNCEAHAGCSDPLAQNYYCNTMEGNMGCLYNVDLYNPPQSNGAYTLLPYSLPIGFVDDGSCTYDTSIELLENNKFVIKRFDLFGRETTSHSFYIEIYNDGTVEKKYSY
ncbi:MAG: hypothetical protein CMP50_01220 [Flavobacteriales bacterium]|nr:hypothetical protein [Flavobacteriales bacterium]